MLQIWNSDRRYGAGAMLLHWSIAILIIGLLALGLYMTNLPTSPEKLRLIGLHKAFGITVLALACLRLVWRLLNIIPPFPSAMPGWQKLAATAGHWALYGFMFAQPLSGWLMSSAAGFPVSVFGWFTLPNLMAPDPKWRGFFVNAHQVLGYALIVIIAGHAGAALYHHFIQKDTILKRMLPWSFGILLVAVPAGAHAASWQIVPEGSSLGFTATQNDAPVTGTFQKFSGQIEFDPLHLDQSLVHIVVDIGSVSASYDEVAATLKTPDWFSVAVFPQAVFDAKNFSKTGDNRYRADGTLRIRDKNVPTQLNFTLVEYSGTTALAKGSALLKRTDFGIGQGAWAQTDQVKDAVTVDFTIKAKQ